MDAANPQFPHEKVPSKDLPIISTDAMQEKTLEELKAATSDLTSETPGTRIAPKAPETRQRVFEAHGPAGVDHKLIEQADQLIGRVLRMMVEKRASDLHLRAGTPL